jgi:hypothetical protein
LLRGFLQTPKTVNQEILQQHQHRGDRIDGRPCKSSSNNKNLTANILGGVIPVDSFSLYILTLKGRDKLVGILGVVSSQRSDLFSRSLVY